MQLQILFKICPEERNEDIGKTLGVACIRPTDKIRKPSLRWYGHVMRREDDNSMKRIIMTAEVNGRRIRGRQKKRWGDMIQDMKLFRVKKEDRPPGERKKWRRRIRVTVRFIWRD